VRGVGGCVVDTGVGIGVDASVGGDVDAGDAGGSSGVRRGCAPGSGAGVEALCKSD
jgi:hypothetical protein